MRNHIKATVFLSAILVASALLCGCEDEDNIPHDYTGQLVITIENKTDDPISVTYYEQSPVLHIEKYRVVDSHSSEFITVYFDDSYASLTIRKGYIDEFFSLSSGNSTTLKIRESDFDYY